MSWAVGERMSIHGVVPIGEHAPSDAGHLFGRGYRLATRLHAAPYAARARARATRVSRARVSRRALSRTRPRRADDA